MNRCIGTNGWERLDARVGFTLARGPEIYVYGKNLTDDRYATYGARILPNLVVLTVNRPPYLRHRSALSALKDLCSLYRTSGVEHATSAHHSTRRCDCRQRSNSDHAHWCTRGSAECPRLTAPFDTPKRSGSRPHFSNPSANRSSRKSEVRSRRSYLEGFPYRSARSHRIDSRRIVRSCPFSPRRGTDTDRSLCFLHGGAFATGGSEAAWYDGHRLAAEQDVVVVPVTYRLGALGFWLPDGSSDLSPAYSDIVTSLQWVQEYIDRFGGDPANVTLAGQSAGCCAAMELTDLGFGGRLYKRVVAMSGGRVSGTRKEAEERSRTFDRILGMDPHTAPVEALRNAYAGLPRAPPRCWATASHSGFRLPRTGGHPSMSM